MFKFDEKVYPRQSRVTEYNRMSLYDLDGESLDDIIKSLQELKYKAEQDYLYASKVYLEVEKDYDDEFTLITKVVRPESDAEYEERVRISEAYINTLKEYRRLEYLKLKEEFQNG